MPKREQIIEKINAIYSETAQEVIEALQKPPILTFRLNTLKATNDVLTDLKKEGFDWEAAVFPHSFRLAGSPDGKKLSETYAFRTGLIYIQGLSSMACTTVLDPQRDERILDLCAAPGSKTSHIAALMHNTGQIVAVEKNKVRLEKLKANLGRLGVKNVRELHSDGYLLPESYPDFIEHFDKVLIDAPCSNEGYIVLDDPQTYAFWNKNKYKDMVWQQKGLIKAGFDMLTPGGMLVYSTCTLSVEENERVVDWLLSKYSNAAVENAGLHSLPNVIAGKTSWKSKQFHQDMVKTARILPNGHFRPFFIARIKKKG